MGTSNALDSGQPMLDSAVTVLLQLAHHAPHQLVRVLLLLPAPSVRGGAVLLDALNLERGAHDDRLPDRREDDGDEPLAAAGVVPGEVLVVGARRGDQAVELAAVELGLGALDAAGKNLRS